MRNGQRFAPAERIFHRDADDVRHRRALMPLGDLLPGHQPRRRIDRLDLVAIAALPRSRPGSVRSTGLRMAMVNLSAWMPSRLRRSVALLRHLRRIARVCSFLWVKCNNLDASPA